MWTLCIEVVFTVSLNLNPKRVCNDFFSSFISGRLTTVPRDRSSMARLRRRHVFIAAVVVVLSIGIVFASIPSLPPTKIPHGSLTTVQTLHVSEGTRSQPGFNQIVLPGLVSSESFYVRINVTNGTAGFCVIRDLPYNDWLDHLSDSPRPAFPLNYCIPPTPTDQTSDYTLKFVPTGSGTWFLVALNSNPKAITVTFSPT